MLKANELRIGDFVTDINSTINAFRIDEISLEDNGYQLIMYPNLPDNTRSLVILPLSLAKPIPITEEILLKSGFACTHGYDPMEDTDIPKDNLFFKYDNDTGADVHLLNDQEFYLVEDCDSYIQRRRELTGLHDLQNFYFSLTGKELEINLEMLFNK